MEHLQAVSEGAPPEYQGLSGINCGVEFGYWHLADID
jgi:hypothetical protein